MKEEEKEAASGEEVRLCLKDDRLSLLWLYLPGLVCLAWVAWLLRSHLPLQVTMGLWLVVSALWMIRLAGSRPFRVCMTESEFILKKNDTEWRVPYQRAERDSEEEEWFIALPRGERLPIRKILPIHEGMQSDLAGEVLMKAGYDFGIPGWTRLKEPSSGLGWTAQPYETGPSFAILGCFVPFIGFVIVGILFSGNALLLAVSCLFWIGWAALAGAREWSRERRRWRFEAEDLLVQIGRNDPARFTPGDMRALTIVEAKVGWKRGKQIILVTHYGREVPITRLEALWSASSASLLNEARARGISISVHKERAA